MSKHYAEFIEELTSMDEKEFFSRINTVGVEPNLLKAVYLFGYSQGIKYARDVSEKINDKGKAKRERDNRLFNTFASLVVHNPSSILSIYTLSSWLMRTPKIYNRNSDIENPIAKYLSKHGDFEAVLAFENLKTIVKPYNEELPDWLTDYSLRLEAETTPLGEHYTNTHALEILSDVYKKKTGHDLYKDLQECYDEN